MARTVVGIDLGTTFSLVASMADGSPSVIPNIFGDSLTPSVVGLDDRGEILVGSPAAARRVTHPHLTASLFKRSMGTQEEITLGSQRFRPEELSALVLRSLREDAERHLGRSVDEAVVTVPAYFGEKQRTATKDACEIAGLHVERIINEPTAAALAFGLENRDRELRAIVLDLGGGTFDVTVLEILEGVIEVQATAGDVMLGGEDFSTALYEHFCAELERRHPGGRSALRLASKARLLRAAEETKRSLSTRDRAHVSLADLDIGKTSPPTFELELELFQVEQLWQPLLERMKPSIFRALSDAKLTAQAVDEVLLVGGATRVPCVRKLAQAIFGSRQFPEIPPDEAVVHGAAIQAELKAGNRAIDDMVVTDVAPFSLGINVSKRIGSTYIPGNFMPILERGTVLPASRMRTISPIEENQRVIQLEIYQGEHFELSRNQKLATFRLDLPQGRDQPDVEVRFTYDLNGLLEIDAEVVGTGRKQTFLVEKAGSNLTKKELDAARERMRRIKFHPREALPNVRALARADELYIELRGDTRELLADQIAHFRAALESQEPTRIEGARRSLQDLTAELARLRRRPHDRL